MKKFSFLLLPLMLLTTMHDLNSMEPMEIDTKVASIIPTQIQLKKIFAETLGPEAASSEYGIMPLILAYYYEPLKMKIAGKALHGVAWLGSNDTIGSIDCDGGIKVFPNISDPSMFFSNTHERGYYSAYFYALFYSQSKSLLSIDSYGIMQQWSRDLDTKPMVSIIPGEAIHYAQKSNCIYRSDWNRDYRYYKTRGTLTIQRINLHAPTQTESLGSIVTDGVPSQIIYSPHDETFGVALGTLVAIRYIENLQALRTLEHSTRVTAMAYAPSPNQIATANGNGIHVWNYMNGSKLHTISSSMQHIKDLAYPSKDSIMMLGTDDDDTNTFLAEWNIVQKKEVQKFTFEKATYRKLSLSPNKSRIALWGYSGLQLIDRG